MFSPDAFDLKSQRGGKVLFVADHYVHQPGQLAVHFAGALALPPIDFHSESR